jgi:hypothetical protein
MIGQSARRVNRLLPNVNYQLVGDNTSPLSKKKIGSVYSGLLKDFKNTCFHFFRTIQPYPFQVYSTIPFQAYSIIPFPGLFNHTLFRPIQPYPFQAYLIIPFSGLFNHTVFRQI